MNKNTNNTEKTDIYPKYVAQGLLETWKKEKELDTENSKISPLEYFLRYNYQERYVKMCMGIGIKPCSFSAYLFKPINSFI